MDFVRHLNCFKDGFKVTLKSDFTFLVRFWDVVWRLLGPLVSWEFFLVSTSVMSRIKVCNSSISLVLSYQYQELHFYMGIYLPCLISVKSLFGCIYVSWLETVFTVLIPVIMWYSLPIREFIYYNPVNPYVYIFLFWPRNRMYYNFFWVLLSGLRHFEIFVYICLYSRICKWNHTKNHIIVCFYSFTLM